MSNADWCKVCGAFMLYSETHTCPPAFLVWEDDELIDDAVTVLAVDFKDAAEKYAEELDRGGDYDIVSGSPVTVDVREQAGTEIQRFEVSGESVPEYHANRKKEGGQA